MVKLKKIGYLIFLMVTPLGALKLDRVILGVDSHPNYIEFWPMIAKAWQHLGIKPTLALIANKEVVVDESLGEVIRFEPIADLPTWFQAQNIRLLLPTLFPEEVCITADMDMLPISKSYFIDSVSHISEDCFVVYNDRAYQARFPICYLAAKGKIFQEILRLEPGADFDLVLRKWFDYDLGWGTDELVFYRYLTTWKDFDQRCIKLGCGGEPGRRICRSNWQYDRNKLPNHYYDAHLPRPYKKFYKEVDKLVHELGLNC